MGRSSAGSLERTASRASSRLSASSLSLQVASLGDNRRGQELHASVEALHAVPRDPRFYDPQSEAMWDNTSPVWGRYIPEFGVKRRYSYVGQLEDHVRRPPSVGILAPRGIPRVSPLISYNSIGWNRRHYEPLPEGSTMLPSVRLTRREPFMGPPARMERVDTSARPPIVLHSHKKSVGTTRIGVWY
ncbi:hypothetical protein AB1Y20_013072 [Prymnesium parvum]|uniref:Uncharacterized protein n=1 Tax=Prymnesium parvum TaxID=97485 RepID=A0AB34IK73_PRYPA|mmetsp:Transcript_15910/g.39884  ORF Transcript_15910/g.39884 Transcript_15910/m.39884 type:complete len:187 (-) Transcript_15910:449-1009(-)